MLSSISCVHSVSSSWVSSLFKKVCSSVGKDSRVDCAVLLGDPRQLIHPTDSEGNLFPANALKGRPFVCPTTQVCVEECPNATTYYKFESYGTHAVCTYDVDKTPIEDYSSFVDEGKCASYIIASKPLFGRCIPDKLQGWVNGVIHVTDLSRAKIREVRALDL